MGTKKRFPGLFYRKDQMHSQDAAKLNDAIKANEGYTKKISYLAKVDDPEVYPQVNNLYERVHGDGVGESTWFKKTVKEKTPVRHTVSFSCAHGSVAATVDGETIVSGANVIEGKSVVFTITPDEGYEYTGTNPETVVVTADVTKTYECTPVPPTTPLFAYGIDVKVGEIVVENFILNGLHPSDHEIPGVEIPESYKDIEYYAPGNYFFFNTNPASATDFYMVTNSGGTWSAQQYNVNEWAPMEEGIDARHMFKTGLTSPCAVSALVELAESGEESIGALLYAMWDLESDPTISYQTSNSSFLGVFTPTEEHPVPYVGAGLYTSDESHTLVSTIKELNVELPVVH